MIKTHIRTFLGNMSLDTVECYKKYRKRLEDSSSGYNRYWSSQQAIVDMVAKEAPYDLAVGVCGERKNPEERITNQEMTRVFAKWLAKNPRAYFDPPSTLLYGPSNELVVDIKPDIGLRKGEKHEVVLNWGVKGIPLSQRIAGIGIRLMQRELGELCPKDTSFFVHDLIKAKRYTEAVIPTGADDVIQLELMKQESALLLAAA